MTGPDLHLPPLGAPGDACSGCAAPLAGDQRYCLDCGTRRGAPRLDPLLHARGDEAVVPAASRAAPRAGLSTVPALLALGRPRVLATAAMLVLGFGVAIGAAAGPPAATGLTAAQRILVAAPPAAIQEPAASADATAVDAGVTDTAAAEPAGDAVEAPVAQATTPDATAGGEASTPGATADAPAAPPTPPAPPAPVKHVWLVALREAPPALAFSATATTPVVPDLVAQGTVLTRYASIAPGSLANRIALLSGQAPTAATLAECPTYTPVKPGTIAARTGLVSGDGCLYPDRTATLTGQLTGAGLTWKGYFEDMGAAPPPADTSCRRPAPGAADPFALPRPGDAYLTRSDPFVYFRSIADSPDCGPGVVGLDRLAPDLEQAELTPAFSFIAPSACHDGATAPCAAGAAAGLPAAGAWLTTLIPQITASPAYAEGGLIVITFDGGVAGAQPQTRPQGSTVGALLLSPYVAAGATVDAAYDHYALLKTVERLFGLPALGHAADAGVAAFGREVFANAPASGSD